ncbi:hypothetical protein HAX54_022454, partial [Datura stramonium]|nr:hypothetical protein [Datura stramonium]
MFHLHHLKIRTRHRHPSKSKPISHPSRSKIYLLHHVKNKSLINTTSQENKSTALSISKKLVPYDYLLLQDEFGLTALEAQDLKVQGDVRIEWIRKGLK